MSHARLPHDAQPPYPQPPDEDELGPQRDGLDHVRRPADAAVERDDEARPVPEPVGDLLQRVQARDGAVHLPTRVVRHHDALEAQIHRPLGVVHPLDALEQERLAPADLAPPLARPHGLVPRPRAAVPDVVDPQRAGLLGLRRRVDAAFGQPPLEDGVREAEVGADAAVEGVVARRDVVVPPPELPRVRGEDAGGEAGGVGARQQREGELVVVRHVELEEAGPRRDLCLLPVAGGLGLGAPGVVGPGDVLDGAGAGGGEAVGEAELAGDAGDGELPLGVVDLVDADGGDAYGGGDGVAEEGGARGALVGVDELAGQDLVPEEGLAVGEVGVREAGVGGGVVPGGGGKGRGDM